MNLNVRPLNTSILLLFLPYKQLEEDPLQKWLPFSNVRMQKAKLKHHAMKTYGGMDV
jgi:hypothetical protein